MDDETKIFGLGHEKLARLWKLGSDNDQVACPGTPRMPEAEPEIEGYQIIKKLGEGGMSTVWRALQLSTQRYVALKIMTARTFGSKKALIRFEREVELTARLEHPNLARIYDSGLYQGMHYYTMELLEGEHLDQYLNNNKYSQRQTLELIHKICLAIQHAHQRGVIHRDLKPSNIIITDDGQPHILDFGLARAFMENNKGKTVSTEGEIAGTPAYMSPEQAAGQIEATDIRTDIYSLGVIMFKVLTGQWPYDMSGSQYEILKNIQEQDSIRPSSIVPHFNSDLEAILLKALEKDPYHRYQSVAELAYDIYCWLENLPIVAKSSSAVYLLRKIVTRHRYTSMIAGLLLIILIGQFCFSLQMFAKMNKSKKEYQNVLDSLNQANKRNTMLENQFAFLHFLNAWHDNRISEARFVATYFGWDSREAIAAQFLLDKSLLTEEDFRLAMKNEESWYVEFVMAEFYLKDGNLKKALNNYKLCVLSEEDENSEDQQLFRKRAENMLLELEGKIE